MAKTMLYFQHIKTLTSPSMQLCKPQGLLKLNSHTLTLPSIEPLKLQCFLELTLAESCPVSYFGAKCLASCYVYINSITNDKDSAAICPLELKTYFKHQWIFPSSFQVLTILNGGRKIAQTRESYDLCRVYM